MACRDGGYVFYKWGERGASLAQVCREVTYFLKLRLW